MPTMKELSAKIKRREIFRPFAFDRAEDVSTYFEQDVYSPFMMHVVNFSPNGRSVCRRSRMWTEPAACRVSTRSIRLYYQLIKVSRASGIRWC